MADPRRRSKRRLRILFKVSWIQRKGQKRGPPLPECHPVKNEHHHGMKAWDFFLGGGVFLLKALNMYDEQLVLLLSVSRFCSCL